MRKNTAFMRTLAVMLQLMIIHQVAKATQMNFSGKITNSVSWSTDTVNITGDVTVDSTGSLTIIGEKAIIFQGQFTFIVYGSITAKGTYSSISTGGGRESLLGLRGIIIKPPIIRDPFIRTPKYVTFKYRSYTVADTNNFSNPAIANVGWRGITFKPGSKAYFYLCKFQFAKSTTTSLFVNQGNVTFKSCHFIDNKTFGASSPLIWSYPSNASDSIVLRSCQLYKNRGASMASIFNKFDITYCSIYDNVNYNANLAAIYVSSGTGSIISNKIYNNSLRGIYLYNTNSVLVERNTIYNQKDTALTIKLSIVTISNNLIANNAFAGHFEGSITAFLNNTVVNNGAGLRFIKPSALGGTETYFFNTIVWNNNTYNLKGNINISLINCVLPANLNSVANVNGFGFTVGKYQGNIFTDPSFNTPIGDIGYSVNANTAYWAPLSNSPCINAGTMEIDPYEMSANDVAGSYRIKQGALDIGAYELYQAVDSIKTATTISTNVLWFADTVKVFGNVTVNAGGFLNIAPGTVVSFQNTSSLNANGGSILAKGIMYDSIVFTRQNATTPITLTSGVFWGGIDIQASTDSSIFNFCRFEFANRSVSLKGAAINVDFNNKVRISNSVFKNNISRHPTAPTTNYGHGAAISAFNSDIIIDKCYFTDNLGLSTVFINSAGAKMSNCYFSRNAYDLLVAFATKAVIINTITRSNVGIVSSTPRFVNCEFYQGVATANFAISSSNPKFYNSVMMSPISWSDENAPGFINCIMSQANMTALSKYTQNSILPNVSYLPQFAWDQGTDYTIPAQYKRNSFYPSINKGTIDLPSDIELPAYDIMGNKRVNGENIDIGAIEQQGAAPVITAQPVGNTLCAGNNAIFVVANSDTATYQWEKDGSIVWLSNTNGLILSNIQETNNGAYRCILRNAYGTVTSQTANLIVKSSPVVHSNSPSGWVASGAPATLSVSVSGSFPLYFSWAKDGVYSSSDTLGSLKINTFGTANEGVYKCRISNTCGIAQSNDITLSVAPELRIVSGTTVCENDTFKLSVVFNPTATYTWYKDGQAFDQYAGKNLLLAKPALANIGNYSCKVSNSIATTVVGPVYLSTKKVVVPDILAPVTYADASLSVTIETSASGDEPITYQWYRDGIVMKDTTSQSLVFTNVTKSNEKTYKCLIKNSCNSVETNETKLVIAPQLCMVTNDFESDSNSNMLIWDRNSSYIYDHYNVYRESYIRNKYDKIGEVPYKALTKFVDLSVNPKSQAYMYKITAVDSNSNETDINATAPHKTIHLLVTQGIPSGLQLDWDEYIGFDYNTYSIYRSDNDAPFDSIYSMSSTSRTWTDYNAPMTKNLKYFVSVKREAACYADGRKKAGAGPFTSAVSNMEDNSRLKFSYDNIESSYFKGFEVFPNPFSNTAEIKYRLEKTSDVSIFLYDFSGREIKTITENVQIAGNHNFKFGNELQKGIYFLNVRVGDKTEIVKVVKIK